MAAQAVQAGASPEDVHSIQSAPLPPVPPNVTQGVSAPPKGMHGGEKVGGPDVKSIQAGLAQAAGQNAPNEIEQRQKRAYYRPPGVE